MQDECESNTRTISNTDENSLFCPDKVNEKLQEVIASFSLPSWVYMTADRVPRKCLNCDETLEPISIRMLSLCLNAQYVGDIQAEILCRKCSASYNINFRKECKTASDFAKLIDGGAVKSEPVHSALIGHEENNLATLMIEEDVNRETVA
jgi:hypothetical protein